MRIYVNLFFWTDSLPLADFGPESYNLLNHEKLWDEKQFTTIYKLYDEMCYNFSFMNFLIWV